MQYTMTKPCDACPFLLGSGFARSRLNELASGEFACHKACDLVENENGGDYYTERNEKTPHCAGALIYLEKLGKPHQMMRINERLGFYDHTKLDMTVQVGGGKKRGAKR